MTFVRSVLGRRLHCFAKNACYSDYEDAVVHQSAIGVNADGIVSRNGADFKKSTIAVYSPKELLAVIANV